ncbi:MAG: hypothetical protein AB7O73_00995 [Bacteroidia bacterium]
MSDFVIKGDELECLSGKEALYNFLTDFGNFVKILPEDKTSNFSFDETSCSFNINGITPMKIVLANKSPFDEINYQTEGLGKFSFRLNVKFNQSNGKTKSIIELGGNLNPFILKMAEKPLKDLVVSMNDKLSKLEV